MFLEDLGFGTFFREPFETLDEHGLAPARIASQGRGVYRLLGCVAPLGELRGRLRDSLAGVDRPAVGDWVAVIDGADRASIHAVLPRRTVLVRRAAGGVADAQVVAANIDVVFIVTAVGRDFNVRRLERYLAAVMDGGAEPVIVLNKVDIGGDIAGMVAEIGAIAPGVPVVPASALTGDGVDGLRAYVACGRTAGLVGSSGVGKSSIVNRLLGNEAQDTRATRRDEKGRHTTTRRDLIELPGGGLLIDTPGMREFGLLDEAGGVDTLFADIVALAARCRFADCAHQGEPGCAVAEALESGALSGERFESYRKLQREAAAAARRKDPVLAHNTKRRWKAIHKSIRELYRTRPEKRR